MSIYIKGMEMPKAEFGSMIVAIRPDGMVEDIMGCYIGKAVPVPPHGRLGDLDELASQINGSLKNEGDGWVSSPIKMAQRAMRVTDLKRIINAPTVIPAEEGET